MKNKYNFYNTPSLIIYSIIIGVFFSYIFSNKEIIEPKNIKEEYIDSIFCRSIDGTPILIVFDERKISKIEIINIVIKLKPSEIVLLKYKNIGIIYVYIFCIKENEHKFKQAKIIRI